MVLILALFALLGCAPEDVRSEVPEVADFARPVSLLTGCTDIDLPRKPAPVPEPPEWEVRWSQLPIAIARVGAETSPASWLSAGDEDTDQEVDRDKFE